MTVFTSVIIFFLVALILGSMQLSPGLFSLFYHYALGKNSHQKADNLSLDYILGVETFNTVIWFTLYIILYVISFNTTEFDFSVFPWILAGIFFLEAFLTFVFYYRRDSASTTLFIPRSIADNFTRHAKRVKNRSDAFLLGFMSGFPELIFTLPLFLFITYELVFSTFIPNAIIIIFFIIITIIPLFIIRTLYRTDHHLAGITRWRTKLKPFIRLTISLGFLLLSLAIFYLGAIK